MNPSQDQTNQGDDWWIRMIIELLHCNLRHNGALFVH